MLPVRGSRFTVYSSKPILAIHLRHRSEVIADGVPKLLQTIHDAFLFVSLAAIGQQQIDDWADAGSFCPRRIGSRGQQRVGDLLDQGLVFGVEYSDSGLA